MTLYTGKRINGIIELEYLVYQIRNKWYSKDLFTEFKGVMAENYVLQSLVRQFGSHHYYYWTSGNTAEVEFVLQQTGRIIPIEMKADRYVTAKSLAFYRKQYHPTLSVRLSTLKLRKDDSLLNLPLYLVDKLKVFVEKA